MIQTWENFTCGVIRSFNFCHRRLPIGWTMTFLCHYSLHQSILSIELRTFDSIALHSFKSNNDSRCLMMHMQRNKKFCVFTLIFQRFRVSQKWLGKDADTIDAMPGSALYLIVSASFLWVCDIGEGSPQVEYFWVNYNSFSTWGLFSGPVELWKWLAVGLLARVLDALGSLCRESFALCKVQVAQFPEKSPS